MILPDYCTPRPDIHVIKARKNIQSNKVKVQSEKNACSGVYPKNMALGQVVTQIVGHFDTVWETKQVYTRITLKSKYVTIHGVNRFNSFKVKLGNSVSSGITI